MVNKVHGGVITDQMLTGSIRYLEFAKTGIGANAIGDGNYRAAYATVESGGTGYAVGNVLTLAGGTGTAPTFTVRTEEGGVVTSVAVTTDGDLSAIPSNPASTTGGAGNATLNVVYTSNIIIPGATDATAQTGEFYVNYGSPVVGSAADVALSVLAQRANIVQIAIIDDNTIQAAVENTGFAWLTFDSSGPGPETDLLDAINALGSVTVPDETNTGTSIDFSTGVTITEKFFSAGIA